MQITQFVFDICLVYFGSAFCLNLLTTGMTMLTTRPSLRALRLDCLPPHPPLHWWLRRLPQVCPLRLRPLDQLPLPLHRLLLPHVQEGCPQAFR